LQIQGLQGVEQSLNELFSFETFEGDN